MGREIDFVIKNAESIKQLIQVTYVSAKTDLAQRELESFAVGASELKCDNLLVITWDYEGTMLIDDKTAVFTPLWKWLLKPPEYEEQK